MKGVMSHPYEYHSFVLHEIPQSSDTLTILDAGCGLGIWGYLLRASRQGSVKLVGIDLARPYLYFVKQRNVYDALVRGDLTSLPFQDKTFDYVLAVEVLEHLPKNQGRKLVGELERCCRGKVILTTPNGFRPQEVKGVLTETHLSGWTVGELRSIGFTVRGIGNRILPFDEDRIALWAFFHFISTPIAQVVPAVAENLIAVKLVDGGGKR